MKLTAITISYSCKFNDPQKRYMNHSFSAESSATLLEGEDPDIARQTLAKEVENFVHDRRRAIYRLAELEKQFEKQKKDFGYAVDRVTYYEDGTKQALEKKKEANRLFKEMEGTRNELAKLGSVVELPKPFIDASSQALPESAPLDPDEEGNDADEELDAQSGVDDD